MTGRFVLIGTTVLRSAFLVLGMAVLIFFLVRIIPGDVVDLVSIEGGLTEEAQQQLRQELGLDRSKPEQLLIWLTNMAEGDLGLSVRFQRPVADLVTRALPTTLALASLSFVIGLALAIGIAVAAVIWPRSAFPALVNAVNVWSIAMPTFCAGILGILLFVLWLGWMPLLGNMVLPSLIIGLDVAGQIVKPLHEDLKEAATAPYIRTAHAKGLDRATIVWRHILPNSLSVVIALSGLIATGLVGGTITMEVLFGLPGIGKLALDSVLGRDYPTIQAVAVLLAGSVVAINAVMGIVARLFDPKLKT
ncbi:peptide/nickel transport system permease protein [Rhodobium orientis]|uniref:Peptide ABC transporter permease n=1 Tax=Rhodobium orientis TaxID=34017 RepID=A0A327JXY8_9HYPH|nr:ABC transporter permease [Rhodobium orientis]MBB4302799.1 peptide/nickel transport system permease protein [Rhodobium orientis]MBK5948579.1 peptide ABC transporter permease [Rhodobium orientis]RAI29842.1 peptide ABC transporter permease [Rhodobium orientis]